MRRYLQSPGYTLIELVIVMAIVGVLSSVLVVVINPSAQLAKGRDVKRKDDLQSMQAFLEQYRHDQQAYPTPQPATHQLNTNCPGSSSLTDPGNTITYMRKIPCDSSNSVSYYNNGNYYYSSNGTSYTLIACLEYKQDKDINPSANPAVGGCTGSPPAYYEVDNP